MDGRGQAARATSYNDNIVLATGQVCRSAVEFYLERAMTRFMGLAK